MKKCNDCLEDKPLSEYHIRIDNTKKEKRPRSVCKACHTERTSVKNNKTPENLEKHRLRSFKSHLKITYGLTIDMYTQMYTDQDGRCIICNKEYHSTLEKPKGLFVDHCHKTGKVRSLMCHHCNAAIGHMREDEWVLQNAILYLRSHS